MKQRKLLIPTIFGILAVITFVIVTNSKTETEKLREQHLSHFTNHPFHKTMMMPKKERLKMGLPPNAYNEQMWLFTMDPRTGRPMPERLFETQQKLRRNRQVQEGGTGDATNPWIDRGPNNVGGRTRGIMFDPNDSDFNRVFAGGVTGGLWVNEDITDPNSSWTLVPGIGANISVTVIIHDPNDTNTFYIGSGESYTFGAGVGRGIWKSTDGGVTWANIFGGGPDGTFSPSGQIVNGIFYVNDMVARDVNGTTELYASIAGASFNYHNSFAGQFTGLNEQGLYKSTDDGASWARFNILEQDGTFSNPNDIELDIDNNIWLATTRSNFGFAGGKIFKSTNGVDFTLEHTISGAARTELEPSSTDVNKLWVVANVNGEADIFFTDDAFATVSKLNEPNDADNGIPSTDYARNQAFFNLPIEVDGNDRVFVGGIDLFRSENEGNSWSQISKWSNNNNLAALNVPLVHADQHAIVFRPGAGNENQAVIGNDGGIYFTTDITGSGSRLEIQSRNKDYNTIQFYYGTIDPVDGADGDDLAGGTQDNGTFTSLDSDPGANSYNDFFGGDGAYTEIDDSGQYMIQTYTGNSHRWVNYPAITSAITIVSQGGGTFINTAELDKNLDILYSNATSGSNFRIERVSEFLPGGPDLESTTITNSLLDATISSMKVSPFTTSSTTLFVGLANGKVLRVDQANSSSNISWENISGRSGQLIGSVSDIEFGENEQELFVTIHNYGVNSIWYTEDGGTTWTSIEGDLPDIPVRAILQNPLLRSELIIGTDLGVWKTSDYKAASPEWVQSFNGMSDVSVVDLDLRSSDNLVLASTHGRGFFTSNFTATTASLEDVVKGEKQFTIYPTVSDGNITVFAKSEMGTSKLLIYDISGRQVFNTDIDFAKQENNPVTLNLKSGMYIVSVSDSKGKNSSQKIIIE